MGPFQAPCPLFLTPYKNLSDAWKKSVKSEENAGPAKEASSAVSVEVV